MGKSDRLTLGGGPRAGEDVAGAVGDAAGPAAADSEGHSAVAGGSPNHGLMPGPFAFEPVPVEGQNHVARFEPDLCGRRMAVDRKDILTGAGNDKAAKAQLRQRATSSIEFRGSRPAFRSRPFCPQGGLRPEMIRNHGHHRGVPSPKSASGT